MCSRPCYVWGRSLLVVLRCLILAWQFATVWPAPRIRDVQETEIHWSMAFVPLVGFVLGVFLWMVDAGLEAWLPTGPSAGVALALYTASTGALHVDGWMDTVDGLASRRPQKEALAIMKDSRSGAVGVVFGVCLLLIKFTCLSSVPASFHIHNPLAWSQAAWLCWAPMLSRLGMIWSMRMAPPAQPGQGLGAVFAGRVPIGVLLLGSVCTLTLGVAVLPVGQVLLAAIWTLFIAAGFSAWMRRRFGGMTGDTYGALHEITETLLWLMAVALLAGEG